MSVWLCTVASDLSVGSMDVCSTGVRMVVAVVVFEADVLDAVCGMLDETYGSLFGGWLVYHTVLLECGCRYLGGDVGLEV